MRRFRLGAYPAVGISTARNAARTMREAVRQGADPIADARRNRDREQAARAGIGTLGELLVRYGASPAAPRTWPSSVKTVSLVFHRLVNRPIATLTVADLQLTADGHKSPQTAGFAVRCIRPALKWAARPGRGYAQPELASIHPPATPQRRDRVLSHDELARILPALRASTGTRAKALRFPATDAGAAFGGSFCGLEGHRHGGPHLDDPAYEERPAPRRPA